MSQDQPPKSSKFADRLKQAAAARSTGSTPPSRPAPSPATPPAKSSAFLNRLKPQPVSSQSVAPAPVKPASSSQPSAFLNRLKGASGQSVQTGVIPAGNSQRRFVSPTLIAIVAGAVLVLSGVGYWLSTEPFYRNCVFATLGSARAAYTVGAYYKGGQKVAQSYAQAATWFKKSADAGYAPGQFEYGVLQLYGLGTPEDHAQALGWLEKAAGGGVPEAQFMLGGIFFEDRDKNPARGEKWLKAAAQKHYEPAEYYLANKYLEGRDLPENYFEAYVLFSDLRSHGLTQAAVPLEALRALMTPEELTAAKTSAAAFEKTNSVH